MNRRRLEIEGIPAILQLPERPRGAVLFFHGAGGSKERSARLAAPLVEAGFLTLHPDALHHGERGGAGVDVFRDKRRIVEAQTASIAEGPRLLSWLKDRFPELKVGLAGASMGGYVVHELLSRGVEVEAAAVWMSAAEPPAWLVPYLPQDFEPALSRANAYRTAPLLHLHGKEDPVVPLALAERTVATLAARFAPGALGLTLFPGVAHTPTPEMAALSAGWFSRWL